MHLSTRKFVFIIALVVTFVLCFFLFPISTFFVVVFSLVHLWIFTRKNKTLIIILLLSFYIKILLIFYHVSVGPLFGSAKDATAFHIFSSIIGESLWYDFSMISFNGWKLYVSFIGVFYYLLGSHEMIPLLINTVLSLFTIFYIFKISNILSGNIKTSIITIIVVSYFPNFVLNSVLNLREIPIIFLQRGHFIYI